MKACEYLFWCALAVVFYTYMGYGIVLYLAVKLKELLRKPASPTLPDDRDLPELTLFIAAYNEEAVVDAKMRNCLELDYPPEKLHILWVTDGSDDDTVRRLSRWPQATVLHQPERRGKTAALNRGMAHVTTPLTVFTDANTLLNREALKKIVQSFTRPEVGCVAGEKRVQAGEEGNAASGGEGLYWKYESALKGLDARLYSAAGAAGELFAIRSSLFEPMPDDTLLDDFVLSLRIVMQGYVIDYRADAYATENGSADMREEAKRKVRIAAGGVQSVKRLKALLNPLRYGVFSFQYLSHRVLRWSLTPVLLFLLLPLNFVLLFSPERGTLYAVLWLLQALFYLTASCGYYLSVRNVRSRLLLVPCYFLFMNANVIRGFKYLRDRKQQQKGCWEKARRA